MKICFPISSNDGLESPVYNHFGSAPKFLLVDSETAEATVLSNQDLGHAHGLCKPLKAIAGHTVDAIVVGGIGKGALAGLHQAGLKVYLAQEASVADNLASLMNNTLPEVTADMVCGGHSHGHDRGSHHEFGCGF